jgi:hypothetical protein
MNLPAKASSPFTTEHRCQNGPWTERKLTLNQIKVGAERVLAHDVAFARPSTQHGRREHVLQEQMRESVANSLESLRENDGLAVPRWKGSKGIVCVRSEKQSRLRDMVPWLQAAAFEKFVRGYKGPAKVSGLLIQRDGHYLAQVGEVLPNGWYGDWAFHVGVRRIMRRGKTVRAAQVIVGRVVRQNQSKKLLNQDRIHADPSTAAWSLPRQGPQRNVEGGLSSHGGRWKRSKFPILPPTLPALTSGTAS